MPETAHKKYKSDNSEYDKPGALQNASVDYAADDHGSTENGQNEQSRAQNNKSFVGEES